MRKFITIAIAALMTLSLVGCAAQNGNSQTPAPATNAPASTQAAPQSNFNASKSINVVSREEGSGTRGAFIELFGVEQKDANGEKVDYTTEEAAITNSTSVMLTSVASDQYAIGYISLGSLNDTVKALEIDGAAATAENILSGAYKIARPFNIATKGELSEAAQDFINFVLSAEGQAVVTEHGYIALENAPAFAGGTASGKVVIAGSSSVSPVMEKLKEAYAAKNANVSIEMQTSDSTTGMTSTIDGICDIGMASRALKDSELEAGLTATEICRDGIAVIVNLANPLAGLTAEQVKQVYVGETLSWDELVG